MKRIFFPLVLFAATANAQTPVPGTDLFLFSVNGSGDTVRFLFEKNITQREGYDNQPCFSPDGKYIYYSAVYKNNNDIYRIDPQTRRMINISKSPYSSEFSPMAMDDAENISAVLIEEDSVTQRMWKINKANAKARLINKKIDSVGYYWPLGNNEYAAFVLGSNGLNHSLRILNTENSTEEYITDSVGRCMRNIPGTQLVSFVRKPVKGNWQLLVYDRVSKKITASLLLPAQSEDYAWWNNRVYITTTNGIAVYEFNAATSTFSEKILERDFSDSPVLNPKRICFSPDFKWLVVVGDDAPAAE